MHTVCPVSLSRALPIQPPPDFLPVSVYDDIPLRARVDSPPSADLVAALRAIDRTRMGATLLFALNDLQARRGLPLRIVQQARDPNHMDGSSTYMLAADGALEWHIDLRSRGGGYDDPGLSRDDRHAMAVLADLRNIVIAMTSSGMRPAPAYRWEEAEFRRQVTGAVERPFVAATGSGARACGSPSFSPTSFSPAFVPVWRSSGAAQTTTPGDSADRQARFGRLTWVTGTRQSRNFEKAPQDIAATFAGARVLRVLRAGLTPVHVRFADPCSDTLLPSRLALAARGPGPKANFS